MKGYGQISARQDDASTMSIINFALVYAQCHVSQILSSIAFSMQDIAQ